MESEDLYQVLGVASTAGAPEIVRAYKLLALKIHPDKNRDDPDATRKFQKVVGAYEILSDPKKRKMYDISRSRGEYKPTRQGQEQEQNGGGQGGDEPESKAYAEKGFHQEGPGPKFRAGREGKPMGVKIAESQKPWPGAGRYTAGGMPVGKEEESRPERAADEFRVWQQMRASGTPPKAKGDWTWT